MASNNNSNNQPRRKRNKKPVKRYSEEYNNRPNPYTGYSADGNYHPEAKKRPVTGSSSARARTSEEERIAAMNAAMAETAWGPVASRTQQPPAQQASRQGNPPATVSIPAPNWAISNNLTSQQMSSPTPDPPSESPAHNGNSGHSPAPDNDSSAQPSAPTPRNGGTHRKKNHRGRDESARERAAKTEAKRAAVDKIAKGVAAHSVSEQMIDDIASISDAIESMPKPQKAPEEKGVNWEEFYDAAFPSKAQESSKFAGRKSKQPRQKADFIDDASAGEPMIVKPVMLGDDELLPYDKIVREKEQKAAEAKAAEKTRAEKEKKADHSSQPAHTKAAQFAEEVKRTEEKKQPSQGMTDHLPPMEESAPKAPDLDSAEDMLDDISAAVTTVSIEEILASVEKQKHDSARTINHVSSSAEIGMDTLFSFDSGTDSEWSEVIPSRAEEQDSDNEPADQPASVLSERLMQSFTDDDHTSHDAATDSDDSSLELDGIESVDINQFLLHTEPKQPEIVQPTVDEEPETQEDDFVPEIIIDSAQFEKQEATQESKNEPAPEETVCVIPDQPEEKQPTVQIQEEPRTEAPLPKFVEEKPQRSDVEVIIADLEDEIFAEEKIVSPEGEESEASPSGIDVEDKIEKLAEAAEVAELFRQENEDVIPGSDRPPEDSGAFNVSIDEISVTPDTKPIDEDDVKEYQPREKTHKPDENLFESVLIVDENPAIIDKAASEGQDESLFLHTRESSDNPTAVFKLPEGPIVFPTDIDDAEFQEQWLDEEEDGDDMESRNKRTRRRISAFIGAVALLFAVMILFSAVKTVVSGFTNIGSTSEKKAEYTEFISPVVINDPMPFETIEKADNNMLLKSSIWQALRELDETEGYEHDSDATNKIVLPAENVEKAAKELFGKDVKLNMNVLSEYDGSAIYYYDSIDKSFHITRSGITGPSAVITKIAQKSDSISLVVGYINQEEMTLTSSEGSEEECYKFMEYVLAVNSNGSYYIRSIRNYVDD